MTREEALQQLKGTWDFVMVDGRYIVNDVALLADIARHESVLQPVVAPRPVKPVMWAAQVTQYGLA